MRIRNSKIAYVFVTAAFICSIYLIIALKNGNSIPFDREISSFFMNVIHDSTYPVFHFITGFGDKMGIGIMALFVIAWLWVKKRDYTGISIFVLAVAIGNEFNEWIKEAVGRPRPHFEHLVDVKTLSFPSGHAMVGLILYMLTAYFLINELSTKKGKWIVGIVAIVVIFLIGISRIALQVHYPSDVFGGYALGFIWTFLWISIYEKLKRRKNK
ncbi:phosphatase PAP2 family protein [Bacillus sp. 03113]|uniref:phosphatase PAP2 family protein n=1 Tax=Bacillus sp. 03113 TaxID=2578211 RepID=UPI00114136FC|nr:phosphatase PAP2 family protein [Bacillus sp. 03113]